jgi:superfamily II DNA or RNA helicase
MLCWASSFLFIFFLMEHRVFQATYRLEHLMRWADQLDGPWEQAFGADVLRQGRRFYLENRVLNLHLDAHELVVSIKGPSGKSTDYAVLENFKRPWVVRGSSASVPFCEAIVVAGLYEVQALVAQATPVGPAETTGGQTSPQADSDFRRRPVATPERLLCVRLQAQGAGLYAVPYWQGPSEPLIPILGDHAGQLSLHERELWIRFLRDATQEGWVRHHQGYVLRDPQALYAFLNGPRGLKQWEKHYTVDCPPEALAWLRAEPQVVQLRFFSTSPMRPVGPKKGRHDNAGHAEGPVTAFAPRAGLGSGFDWGLQAGARRLTTKQTKQLESAQPGLVVLPGCGFVQVTAPVQRISAVLRQATQVLGSATLPPYMLFALLSEPSVLDWASHPDGLAWREALGRVDENPSWAHHLPGSLRPYQRLGVLWMGHLCDHGCHPLLADEMGLGKTLQALSLMVARPAASRLHLVLTPASVTQVWLDQARLFFPQLPVHLLRRQCPIPQGLQGLVVASYTQLRKHKEALLQHAFAYVILDEAQQIKNPHTKTAQACFALRAQHRIALSGTPLENHARDLWSLFRFLMPGLLGSLSHFDHVAKVAATQLAEPGSDFESQIRPHIAPFVLRRLKAQVAQELPPKTLSDCICPLTPLQRTRYQALCKAFEPLARDDSPDAPRRPVFSILQALTQLRQLACHADLGAAARAMEPGLLLRPESDALALAAAIPDGAKSGKLQVLVQKLEEPLLNGHRVVIFSQFVRFLRLIQSTLQAHYPQVPIWMLTGQTRQRHQVVQAFQEHRGAGVFLASLKAAGTGITLHGADYVFVMDPWWNPAVEDQAIDRVHRIGQTQPVFVYRLISQGTLEHTLHALQQQKRQRFAALMTDQQSLQALGDYIKLLLQVPVPQEA